MPAFVNNLAWVLANGKDADLPRALKTIDPAVERWPGDPHLRATRGEILVKLERWKEALPDLEAAVKSDSGNAALHRFLAETYEHLDAPAMAVEHRKRAGTASPGK
jgi:predicted Zn-dependent protease